MAGLVPPKSASRQIGPAAKSEQITSSFFIQAHCRVTFSAERIISDLRDSDLGGAKILWLLILRTGPEPSRTASICFDVIEKY